MPEELQVIDHTTQELSKFDQIEAAIAEIKTQADAITVAEAVARVEAQLQREADLEAAVELRWQRANAEQTVAVAITPEHSQAAKTITVSIDAYRKLIADSMELDALNAAGVDNWQGRDEVEWPTDAEIDERVQDDLSKSIGR